MALASLLSHQRSFREDAVEALRSSPPIRLEDQAHIPAAGPFLLVLNHYNHPAVPIWWPVMAISAALPSSPHWIMTAAWTFSGRLRSRTLGPLSAWAFTRVARVYNFTNMPVMPPRPHEEAARAAAVRKVILYARTNPAAVVGLAPEGHNTTDMCLGWPPPGSGRFMLGLAERLHQLLPVGIYPEGAGLTVRFGRPFTLQPSSGLARAEIDRQVARQVMARIAALLPARMRGEY